MAELSRQKISAIAYTNASLSAKSSTAATRRSGTAMNVSAVTRPPLFGPQALGALFILLWSTAWIAGEIGLEFTGPLTLLEIRFTAAALVMLLVVLLTG